jgi:hypothetical protein
VERDETFDAKAKRQIRWALDLALSLKGFTDVKNANSKQSISHYDLSVKPTYVLVSERPSPFIAAEKVRQTYATKLDELLTEATIALSVALGIEPLSEPTPYQLAELAGYLHRVTRLVHVHERQVQDSAATAELAERGLAWVTRSEAV